MKAPDHDELAAFGVDPSTAMELESQESAPDDGVGRGLSTPPPPLQAAELDDALASVTRLDAFARSAARMGDAGAALVRSDRRRGVYGLSPETLRVVGATSALDDGAGSWIIDAQGRRALVHVRGSRGDAMLVFEDGTFQGFSLREDGADAPRADELLGGLAAPAWLLATLDEARGALALTCAVASLGRLWAPRDRASSQEAMERLKREDDPLARARGWFASRGEAFRGRVLTLALQEIETLAAQLDRITERSVSEPEAARAEALEWLERRDDLASLRALIRAPGDPGVNEALASLDRAARVRATMWKSLSPLRSPRLQEVSWQEPGAWWAEPARVG